MLLRHQDLGAVVAVDVQHQQVVGLHAAPAAGQGAVDALRMHRAAGGRLVLHQQGVAPGADPGANVAQQPPHLHEDGPAIAVDIATASSGDKLPLKLGTVGATVCASPVLKRSAWSLVSCPSPSACSLDLTVKVYGVRSFSGAEAATVSEAAVALRMRGTSVLPSDRMTTAAPAAPAALARGWMNLSVMPD